MLYTVCCFLIIIIASSAAAEGPAFQWPNRPQLIAFTFEGSLSSSTESLALLSQFPNGRLACSQSIPATWFASDCTPDVQTLQSNHWEIGAFSDNDASTTACLVANATVKGLRVGNGSDSSGFQYTMFESPSFMWPFIESNIVRVPFTNPTSVGSVAVNYQSTRAPMVVSLSNILQNVGLDITKMILKQIMSLDEIVAVTTGQLAMLTQAKSATEAELIVNLCRSVPIQQTPATISTSTSDTNSSAPADMSKSPIPSQSLPQGVSSAAPDQSVSLPATISTSKSDTNTSAPADMSKSPIPSQPSPQGISSAAPNQSVSLNNSSPTGIEISSPNVSRVPKPQNSSSISNNITSSVAPSGNHSGANTTGAGLPVTTGGIPSGKNSSEVSGVNSTGSSKAPLVVGTNQTSNASISGNGTLIGDITKKPTASITGLTPVPTPRATAVNATAAKGFTMAPDIIGQKPASDSQTDSSTGSGNDSSQSSSKSAGYVPYVIGIGGGLCAMAVAIVYKVFKREDRFPPVITSGYVFESEDRGIYDLEACNDSVRAGSEESRERSSSYVHSELESVSTT